MIRLAPLGYYTPLEAAECLDIRVRTLYNWIDSGAMIEPVLKQKRLVLWRKKDVHSMCKKLGKPLFGGRKK